jgi:hypothetical protein
MVNELMGVGLWFVDGCLNSQPSQSIDAIRATVVTNFKILKFVRFYVVRRYERPRSPAQRREWHVAIPANHENIPLFATAHTDTYEH